jgi:hypothetical protein
MDGYGGVANLGGAADPRLGGDADAIGKGNDAATGAAQHDLAVGDTRRGSISYNDSSILFEEYHYWANRSREYERTIDVSNLGLQGMTKKGKRSKAPQDLVAASDSDDGTKTSEKQFDNATGERGYGITESEWENAQRSVRTATWGKIHNIG